MAVRIARSAADYIRANPVLLRWLEERSIDPATVDTLSVNRTENGGHYVSVTVWSEVKFKVAGIGSSTLARVNLPDEPIDRATFKAMTDASPELPDQLQEGNQP